MNALINIIILAISILFPVVAQSTALDEELNHLPVGTMCAYEGKVSLGEIREMQISDDNKVVTVVTVTGEIIRTDYDLLVVVIGERGNDIIVVPDRVSGTFVYSLDGGANFSPMPQ